MASIIKCTLPGLLLSLLVVQGASAQFIWRVSHTDQIGRFEYVPTAISCWKNTCTVSALVVDDTAFYNFERGGTRLIFLRSDDAGLTWTAQDPGLPREDGNTGIQIKKIQQIDSLHVIAIGDSGLIVRTTDGGHTWERLNCKDSGYRLADVHFSTPLVGVLLNYGYNTIHLSLDGGETWQTKRGPIGPLSCHSYGDKTFQMLDVNGRLYSTTDDWNTVDSSSMNLSTMDTAYEAIGCCSFSGGDTILSFGARRHDSLVAPNTYTTLSSKTLIVVSTDRGKTWTKSTIDATIPHYIDNLSRLDCDTVIAAGAGTNTILVSPDRGMTWQPEIMVLDSTYNCNYSRGICYTASGIALGIFGQSFFPFEKAIIVRGERAKSNVVSPEQLGYNTFVYPNPASDQVTITSADRSKPVCLEDVLGREVLRTILSSEGTATFNLRGIARGVYSVILTHDGKRVQVGKVVVENNRP